MNYDLKTRIAAKKEAKRFYTAVEAFGKHKKRGGQPSMMEQRKGFIKKLFD